VSARGSRARGTGIGVALAPDRICVAVPARRGEEGDAWCQPLDPAGVSAGGWPELQEVLTELRERPGSAAGSLHVALLPPLVQARRIELPPLARAELRGVLTRDAARYFLGAREAQVVGVEPLETRKGAASPVFAAAAPERLVQAVLSAAREAGWTVAAVVPAYAAWAAAAVASRPELRRGAGTAVVRAGALIEVVHLREGRPVLVRRFPGAADPGEALARADDGAPVVQLDPDASALLAARFAPRAPGPVLLPESVHAARRGSSRRLTASLVAAAAACLVVAAGLELWGAGRELAAVQARRGELRESVATVVRARGMVDGMSARFARLDALEAGTPRWSVVLSTLAHHLPADAHLTSVRAAGDSLLLEGKARRALGVMEALQKTPGIAQVRPVAPIRRELHESGPTVEHFVLSAHLGAGRRAAKGER
jgi:hypothetical protein